MLREKSWLLQRLYAVCKLFAKVWFDRESVAFARSERGRGRKKKSAVKMALQLSNACIMPTIISARPREHIFLYYRLYIRYATDRKDRGNKRYYFVRRVTSCSSSRSPPPLARTHFNCSALLTRKEGKKTLVKREGGGGGNTSFILFSMGH